MSSFNRFILQWIPHSAGKRVKAGRAAPSWRDCKLVCLVPLLVSACAGTPVAVTDIETINPDEAVVFGKVILEELKKGELVDVNTGGLNTFRLYILSDQSEEMLNFKMSKEPLFYWKLPPGEYVIAEFLWATTWGSGSKSGRIFSKFEIRENEKCIYLGSLKMTFFGIQYTMAIEDTYQETYQEIKKKFPGLTAVPVRRLMQLEDRR